MKELPVKDPLKLGERRRSKTIALEKHKKEMESLSARSTFSRLFRRSKRKKEKSVAHM